MSEDITPDKELEEDVDFFDDTETDTPDEGNDTDRSEDNSDEKSDVSDEAFLKRVNELEGRNYKSIEAYKKTLKERNKAFATKPKTEEVKNNPTVLENLYFKANPEAQGVWDMVKKEASALKKDPFELYESSEYLKGEAKARAVKEGNAGKVSTPSNHISTDTISEEDKIAKRLDRNLPPGF